MSVLNTDFIALNRGGVAGDGSSGDYYVAPISDLLAIVDQLTISADTGQLLQSGVDGGVFLPVSVIKDNETTTALTYVAGTQTLSFTDEDGGVNDIDLSALTSDLRVDGASVDAAGVLTFTVNDAGVATDFTVDLSTYVNSVTDDQVAGTLTLGSAGATTVVQKTSWMSAPIAP